MVDGVQTLIEKFVITLTRFWDEILKVTEGKRLSKTFGKSFGKVRFYFGVERKVDLRYRSQTRSGPEDSSESGRGAGLSH